MKLPKIFVVGFIIFLSFFLLSSCTQNDQPASEDTGTQQTSVTSSDDGTTQTEEQPPPPAEEPPPTKAADTDADGVIDADDNCADAANSDQLDMDSDLIGDVCDTDKDGDSVANNADNCPAIANANQKNSDQDSDGDLCDQDNDWDMDTVLNTDDNCPGDANTDQWDIDMDGTGDVCDDDSDGDTVANEKDNCPYYSNIDQADTNDSAGGDACDGEIDGYMTSLVKLPLASGSALGGPEKTRLKSVWSVAFLKNAAGKFLYIGEGANDGRISKTTLNSDGTVSEIKAVLTNFDNPVGMAASPDQKSLFIGDYIGATSGILGRVDLNDNGDMISFKNKASPLYSTAYSMYYSTSPAVSNDGKYVYLASIENATWKKSKIECQEIDPDTHEAVGDPKTVKQIETTSTYTVLGSLAFHATGEDKGQLYIVDYRGYKVSMINVEGCDAVSDMQTVVENIKDKDNVILAPLGAAISQDGSKLYFTIGNASDWTARGAIMVQDISTETGLANGNPTLVAGNLNEAGWKDGKPEDSRFYFPTALALDDENKRLYVAELYNDTVKMIQLGDNWTTATSVSNLIGFVTLTANEKKIAADIKNAAGVTVSPEINGIKYVYASSPHSQTISKFKYDVPRGVITSGKTLIGTLYKGGLKDSFPETKFSGLRNIVFSSPTDLQKERWFLYAADYDNHAVRCIHLNPATGEVFGTVNAVITVASGIANNVKNPIDVTVSGDGKYVYIVNHYGGNNDTGYLSYIEVDPDTCYPKKSSATIIDGTTVSNARPAGIAFHKKYIYYTTAGTDSRIKRIEINPENGSPNGGVEVVAGSETAGNAAGMPQVAKFYNPYGIAFSPDGKFIYVADRANRSIRRVDLNDDGTAKYVSANIVGGSVSDIISIDGFGPAASFAYPYYLTAIPVGKNGTALLVSDDYSNSIRMIR